MSTSDTIATSMREKADDAKTARTRMALADLEERLAFAGALLEMLDKLGRTGSVAHGQLSETVDHLTEARRQLQEESVG